jgi:hypothetical protein
MLLAVGERNDLKGKDNFNACYQQQLNMSCNSHVLNNRRKGKGFIWDIRIIFKLLHIEAAFKYK